MSARLQMTPATKTGPCDYCGQAVTVPADESPRCDGCWDKHWSAYAPRLHASTRPADRLAEFDAEYVQWLQESNLDTPEGYSPEDDEAARLDADSDFQNEMAALARAGQLY